MSDTNNKPTWPGWRTMEVLGQGTYGAVYRIEREFFDTKEEAALKVISITEGYALKRDGYDDASISAALKERLEQISEEYRLMKQMNGSSNIVTCDDILMEQNPNGMSVDVLIKMELLTPLSDALPVGEVPEETAIRLGMDMAKALVLCAKNNIIHRDIKPANIFISPNGDYKLGDFGVARTMESTMSATRTGTFDYMSPEVFAGKPYGAAADIYSLGLVLYWAMNERRTPFLPLPPEAPKIQDKEAAMVRRMGGEPLPEPKNGSPTLKKIILKACAYGTEDRYHSAAELLADLEALERGDLGAVKAAKVQGSKQKKTKKRLPLILGGAVLLVVLAVILPGKKEKSGISDLIETVQPASTGKTARQALHTETTYREDGSVESVAEYNSSGNLVKETDYNPDGSIDRWEESEWDGAGNNTKITTFNADGSIDFWEEFEYDDTGRCVRITDYNADGSVRLNGNRTTGKRRLLPNGSEEETGFDSAGNLIKYVLTDAQGSIVWWEDYEYNGAGAITKNTVHNSDGSIDYWFETEYDSTGMITKNTCYNPDGSMEYWIRYEYDNAGRMTRATFYNPDDSLDYWIEYEYDSNGNPTKETTYNADGTVRY